MSVQRGGMFGSQPKAQYSKETAELLKTMMKESKLTNYQQRVLKDQVKDGGCLPQRVNPHHSKDGPSSVQKKKVKTAPRPSKLKSQQTIQLEIENDPTEPYRPPVPKYNSQKEKERLNDILVFGTDKPLARPKPVIVAPAPPKDRFDEIQDEINERRAFLAEMERLGQVDQHRKHIETEISQYIREMEVIDKKRTQELEEHKKELSVSND